MERLQALENPCFLSKFQKFQKHKKNHSTRTSELFWAKNRSKNTKYWRNKMIFKMGHLAKALVDEEPLAIAKWSVWVKN